MDCIGIDEILSTTVLYEGFFNYNEFFKISKESINKILYIANKYKSHCSDLDLNKNEVYLKSIGDSFSREFIYKFNEYISIDKIKYSSQGRELMYYEVYEIIDFENEIDKLILFGSYTGNNEDFIEIFLNGVSLKNIKIKLANKTNIWPNSSEIIFEKHI
ncbi:MULTISPECIES: hypothetical protein [Clostridium]|uniref:hypothetical protein n=1 Tax=Clostridium TaxID=1485 RepID=UPI00189A6844|nr:MULTISPECIES: hypothetical protein [Clostridium]MCR1952350.1 hypothetical protein [Clostridium sp. DSM 100503]MDI9218658.1 hypothetical protein [Clostridium tertium]